MATSTTITYAIETQNLKKVYGDNTAVKNLTLQVRQGEIFGFLGPNGAGKTTSIKMLLGLITPTAGSAALFGIPISDARHAQTVRAKIGFLPEHFRFHDWLSAEEFLTLHGRLYGMESKLLHKRAQEMLALVGLIPFQKKLLRTYSKGMLQRIGIAQALLNTPKLVILDEPTSGLDPLGRRLVRDIIHELRLDGTCVFINSHLLGEIEVTCDRVAFIKQGEVIRVTELDNLSVLQPNVSLHVQGITAPLLADLSQWGNQISFKDHWINIILENEEVIPAIARHLVTNGVEIFAIIPQRPSLEDLFIQTIGTEGGL